MTAPAQATVTDATLARLSNAADRAYQSWQGARVWRKWEAWEQYVEAEVAYWRAFFGRNEKETTDGYD